MKRSSSKSRRHRQGTLRIGTSGWSYVHWRRVFYPEDLPSGKWFGYYARYFNTVEINNTFYSLPKETTLARWYREAPSGFVFAVKANRFITHMKKLKDPEDSVPVFLESIKTLKSRLGPVLFQLPPGLKPDLNRLRALLAALPRRRRYVIEFRNAGWFTEDVIGLLKRRRVALCVHDLLEAPCPRELTASFAYYRFHGHEVKYGGSYPKRTLRKCAQEMAEILENGKDVYAYFNNDAFGYALKDAVALREVVVKLLAE